jgi:hypothetical protein
MDWIKGNAITILITLAGIVGTFTLYGYRIEALETRVEENRSQIASLVTQQNLVNVQLAGIAADIQYIKLTIDRLFGTGR